MRILLIALLYFVASITYANEIDSTAWRQFNSRMHDMLDTTGWRFDQAISANQILREWQSNQARARIKFSKPGIYHGRISKILMDDQGPYFVVDQGANVVVTAHMAGYQAWPWKVSGTKPEIVGVQPFTEFAANFDVGQELFFQCRRVDFGIGIYLRNCLVFPGNVTVTRSAPELIHEFDMSVAFDQAIKARAAEGWIRPHAVPNSIKVELRISMLPDGTITSVNVYKTSGDVAYDKSAVAAVQNIGRVTEAQEMKPDQMARYEVFNMSFAPDDLSF